MFKTAGPSRRPAPRQRPWWRVLPLLLCGVGGAAVFSPLDLSRLGGDLTVEDATSKAFAQPAPSLEPRELRDFAFGNRLFNTNWVAEPASVRSLDGLGPGFNRVSCSGCHTRDGRGHAPAGPDEVMDAMAVRLSVPGRTPTGQPRPHPAYGLQLQDKAIVGHEAEGRVTITWEPVAGLYADGTPYELRRPRVAFVGLTRGPMGEEVQVSPRIAPAVHGVGLLEAVDEATLRAMADPQDADGDGISGRVNEVWSVTLERPVIGRFGWKANQPTLREQSADAAFGDIGLTSSLFREEDVPQADTLAHGPHPADSADSHSDAEEPDLTDRQLDKLEFYLQTLAVPAARGLHSPVVQRGQRLFIAADCNACHTATLQTGADHPVPQLRNQTIHPYSDLLLHDMGEGLADGRPDSEATGSEWRTPPLWGIGLTRTVSGTEAYLHDGRAETLEEAILWHGGEAEAAREAFRRMSREEREAVLAFLSAL